MKLISYILAFCWIFAQLACARHAQGDEPLFRYNDRSYTRQDLPKGTQVALYKLELEYHNALMERVQEAVTDLYFEDLAKREKISSAEVRSNYWRRANQPTEEEMRKFYEKEKGKLPFSFDAIKDELREWIKEQMVADAKRNLLKEIEKKEKVEVFADKPLAPKFDLAVSDYPAKGSPKAPIELVEYGDFTCPECGKAVDILRSIVKDYDGKVRLVFKYYPRDFGALGESIARGAHCANLQGKFWQYHDYAFDNQFRLAWESSDTIAKHLKLDLKKYSKCLDSEESKKIVRSSYDEGTSLGVTATPSFFINGRQITGGHFEDLRDYIDQAL